MAAQDTFWFSPIAIVLTLALIIGLCVIGIVKANKK